MLARCSTATFPSDAGLSCLEFSVDGRENGTGSGHLSPAGPVSDTRIEIAFEPRDSTSLDWLIVLISDD